MAYKRYFYRNGKKFGPYYYESYRDSTGKVKKRYVGTINQKVKKKRKLVTPTSFLSVFSVIMIIFLGLFLVYSLSFSGQFSEQTSLTGEHIPGMISGSDSMPSTAPFYNSFKKIIGFVVSNESSEEVVEEIVEEPVEEPGIGEIIENETAEQGISEEIINETIEISENITEIIENESIGAVNITSNISEANETINETIVIINESIIVVNETVEEPEIIDTNVSIINESIEVTNATISQYKAVIGRPVKWVKKVNASGEKKIKIPKQAKNITIKTGREVKEIERELEEYEDLIEKIDRKSIKKAGITGYVGKDIDDSKGLIYKFFNWLRKFTITGKVIYESELIGNIIETKDGKIIDVSGIVEDGEEIAIEYYTQAPQAFEENLGREKNIKITGPDELHYEDVLAYSDLGKLNNQISIEDFYKIRLYHVEGKEFIDFDYYDLDGDGNIDYVEWVVLHLSEQNYKLIIKISKAEHLDSNRNFIEDVYDYVKEKDNVWFDDVGEGEYLRVEFEQELTSSRDITIYARGNAKVDVFEKDENDLIARFEINGEDWYKVYLTDLIGSNDVFDLLVIGDVDFDYIVDPIGLVQQKADAEPYGTPGARGMNISYDFGTTPGNLLVTGMAVDKNAGTFTVPPGFTLIETASGTASSGAMAYKIADGSEVGIFWNWTLDQEGTGWISEWSGLSAIPYDNSSENESYINTGNTDEGDNSVSVTTNQADELLIAIYFSDSGNSVGTIQNFSDGFTDLAEDTNTSGSPYIHIGNKTVSSAGVHSVTHTHNAAAGNDESYFAIVAFKMDSVIDQPPTVTLNEPGPGNISKNTTITFNCSATDQEQLVNISLYGNWSGWHNNETKPLTGTDNSTTFTKTLTDNVSYLWNCYACDNASKCSFASSNRSFLVDTSLDFVDPNVTLNLPGNDSIKTSTTVTFNCSATDNMNLSNVTLYFYSGEGNPSATVSFQNGTEGYLGSNDTYVDEANSGTNYGTSDPMNIDGEVTAGNERYGIIKWNLSDVPSNAVISQVNITFFITNEGDAYELYQMKRDWVESQANWINYSTGNAWQTAGGIGANDIGSDLLGTMPGQGITGSQTITLTSAGVEVVQGWVNGSINNYGFHINNDTNAYTDGQQWTSSSGATVANRPKITISYTSTDVAWHANETKNLTGTDNSTTFTKTLIDNLTYTWNCLAKDLAGNSNWSIANYSFTVNTSYTDQPPAVTLNEPGPGNISKNTTITFNCSATDQEQLVNISLYGNWSGWHNNETKPLTGTDNSTTFTKTLTDNVSYLWNCYACDNMTNCSFASGNYTFLINTSYSLDPTDPVVDFGPGTQVSGVIVNDSWVYMDARIIEANFTNLTFELWKDGSLVSGVTTENHTGFELDNYNNEVMAQDLSLTSGVSSVTYNSNTSTLFTMHSKSAASYDNDISEIYTNGTLIRNIDMVGWEDVEAIEYLNTTGVNHWFAIAEERITNISLIYINSSTTSIDISDFIILDTGLPNLGNLGIEGIVYDEARDVYYAVKEQTDMEVYQFNFSNATVASELFDAETVFSGKATDLSDVYYDSNTETLFITSDESNLVFQVYLNGTIIANESTAGMTQPEGIAIDNYGDYMYVMGESDEYSRWKTDNFTAGYNFTGLGDGVYYYNITARDEYNIGTTETRNIILWTGTNVTICRNLTEANTTYTLQGDVSATDDCIFIKANNITLDFNGYNMTGDDGPGDWAININGFNYTKIVNGGIYDVGVGINIDTNSQNTNITNMTLISNQYGVKLDTSPNNVFTNLTLINNSDDGVYILDSSSNVFTNIVVSTNSDESDDGAIFIEEAAGTSDNNLFKDCILSTDVNYVIGLDGTASNNTFLNVTYSDIVYFTSTSLLIRKWYYKAYVNDSEGNDVSGVDVLAYNISGGLEFNETTNGTGWTNITEIIDYVQNSTAIIYYSNYTINATNTTLTDEHAYNATANQNKLDDVFTLDSINNWICNSGTYLFINTSCWSLGRAPIAGDDVIFNGTGTANCNITNNTMPQKLRSFSVNVDHTGTIYFNPLFAAGNWTGSNTGTQQWNVSKNIIINNGTMKIYGDYPYNITIEGHGQEWRSLNGNITIGSSGVLDGIGLGFPSQIGPGAINSGSVGGTHGGRGYKSTKDPYGNASAPTSLGSGGASTTIAEGGSAIKLHATDLIEIMGTINMSSPDQAYRHHGSGGSIWIKADNISGNGIIEADGGSKQGAGGGGGRIRLEYGSSMNYIGKVSVDKGWDIGTTYHGDLGTLTFTNSTWPGDWTVNGSIGLLGGDYGDGSIINVQGGFNTNNYNITIFGDCFYNASNPITCYNTTTDGRGVWINASGNITITSGSILDGSKLGFPNGYGPSIEANDGGGYGGKGGGNSQPTYGSEAAPVSLGSGGGTTAGSGRDGGSAIKLESPDKIIVNGEINVEGEGEGACYAGAGGSIWLKADNISGSGVLNATGGTCGPDGGGGGRIALTSLSTFEFSGEIDNIGGIGDTPATDGGGGTVYINGSTSITSSGGITTTGNDGGNISFIDTLLTLSGDYNATGSSADAPIIVNYTDCASSFTGSTFDPDPTYQTACSLNVIIQAPANNSKLNTSSIEFNVSLSRIGSWCGLSIDSAANVTMNKFNDTWFNYTNSSIGDGSHTFVITCNDTGNNFGLSSTYDFYIDTVYPEISFAPNTTGNGTVSSSYVFVNVSANDSASNISTFINFDNSLVSWWRMDDLNATGGVIDYMGRNNGTAVDDAVQVDNGYFGKGFEFDGNGDYVDLDIGDIIGKNYTYSSWVNLDVEGGDYEGIIGGLQYGQVNFYINNNELELRHRNATASHISYKQPYSFNSGMWYHVVGVFNTGTGMELFVNGVSIGSNSSQDTPPNYNVKSIGNAHYWTSNANMYFNGTIDDVMIFNRSLSAEEIVGLYANTSSRYLERNFTDLSAGVYTFKAYTQDLAGNVNSTDEWWVNITGGATSFAIDLSNTLQQQIVWNLTSLPAVNQSAPGNNGSGVTELYVNVSTEDGLIDLYIKANDDLLTDSLERLGLGNETFSYNSSNSSVPSDNKFSLTTNYADNQIGDGLSNGSIVYLKLFLNAPSGQASGTYNNTLMFKGVSYGQSP